MASNSTMRPSSLRRPQQPQQSHDHHLPPPQSEGSSSFNSKSRNVVAQSVRSKPLSSSRRSVTPTSRSHTHSLSSSSSSSSDHHFDNDPGRVRVAVRLRPKNAEDLILDADFGDCIELQPELNRLKLRRNNWNSESYRFDDVFTDVASQKRVYDAVAKPVVESVLNGYNGTVMAYGQTGTGKTYTVGRLGKDDASERGIMVRALEDIISNTTSASDSIEVSYLQLYMESIQDLLAPEKINIPINEDARTGEVSLPGVTIVKVQNLDHFVELLQIGEANRHAANTKLNAESSRSHAILMVYVRRPIYQKRGDEITFQQKDRMIDFPGGNSTPRIGKSKLLVVDLAGSERLDKSGSEGQLLEEAKFINLSLTSLGKCINALAENCPHIPTRDSKLTRLLRDSFGGSARTSLIITIGPSARHHAETASTIMFGQRAMRIVNVVKLKEEIDYESLCRKLENQVDHLTAEIERENKLRVVEKHDFEKKLQDSQELFAEEKGKLVTRSELLEKENSHLNLELKDISTKLDQDHHKCQNEIMHDKVSRLETSLKSSQEQLQLENSMYQKVLAETTQMYEKKISELIKQSEDEQACRESAEEEITLMKKLLSDNQKFIEKQQELGYSAYQKATVDTNHLYETKVAGLNKQLEDECACTGSAQEQLVLMKKLLSNCQQSIQKLQMENSTYQKALADNTEMYEKKIRELIKQPEDKHARFGGAQELLYLAKMLPSDQQRSLQEMREIEELKVKLPDMCLQQDSTQTVLQSLKSDNKDLLEEKALLNKELSDLKQILLVEEKQRKSIEHELLKQKKIALENHSKFEPYMKENISKGSSTPESLVGLNKSNTLRETLSGQRATIAKVCEEVGLQKILQLLASQDSDVQIHAVKVIANLAAEDTNQAKIVEDGGLDALLMLLKSSQNITILRVASGAIANLAMNEMNQGLIISKGGAQLLAKTASKTDDPQSLRMVAGALANLCGNESLHMMLKEDGGIKALVRMARFANGEVIAQVARGMANFAKCESRAIIQEENARDFIAGGGIHELVRISVESNRDDIRNLAKRTLKMSPTFQAEVHSRQ